MTDKNQEVLVCDASIMKNVWEIRLREYGQKIKLEQERVEKSALKRINQDWARRMSGKIKIRKVERKVRPPEDSPAQNYKVKRVALGRPSGFVSSRPQKTVDVKKDVTKRSKLSLLLGLIEKQPGLVVWTKSWKFSQPLPQPEQMPSDWGHSWKCLNFQPNNEGKSWLELEHDTNNNYNILFSWEKVDKALFTQNIEEDITISDWEKSWKYTNQRKEAHGSGRNGPKDLKQEKLHMLYRFHCNKENSSPEWDGSWKSAKPPKEEHVKFLSESVSKEESNTENEEQSKVPWDQSWKHFKRPLHVTAKSTGRPIPPGWLDSWRISKPVSQTSQQHISEHPVIMPEEPLDPNVYQTITDASKEEKYRMLWRSQFQGKDVPLLDNEWYKSWLTIKNLSEYKEQPMEKMREDKSTLQVGFKGSTVKHAFDVFSFTKKSKPVEMHEVLDHKNKESFSLMWKDSWKLLKNQHRQNRARSRQQRMSAPTQATTPPILTEWANSWRFTNLNVNQDSNLWQQGWSTHIQNRPDRWVRANETLNEGIPNNGPTGARRWGESWRSTRHQHRTEREATGSTRLSTQMVDTQHRQETSLSDWEQCWQFSTSQLHQDRPSSIEWADSWRFCSFHCENWAERQPEAYRHERSMEIQTIKDRQCPLHRFSRSFQPQTFTKRFPPQEWKNSWKMKMSDGKKMPGQKELPQSWQDCWMFNTTQLYKSKLSDSSSIHSHSMATAQYEGISEWGQLWKIANAQPPKSIACWSEAQPNTCPPQHMVFCSRNKCNNYLLSSLAKDCVSLKRWVKAWRFMKLESKLDMKSVIGQSKHEDDSVIMNKMAKRHLYFQMDKEAPQVKRWGDACKLAKTQPRPKRDARKKPGQGKDEDDKAMFINWAGAWRFVAASEPVQTAVSLTEWENSWKFLLSSYAPQNGLKKKGRS